MILSINWDQIAVSMFMIVGLKGNNQEAFVAVYGKK